MVLTRSVTFYLLSSWRNAIYKFYYVASHIASNDLYGLYNMLQMTVPCGVIKRTLCIHVYIVGYSYLSSTYTQ